MTVPANDRRSPPYVCTGGETVLGFDFLVRTAAELAVTRLRGGGETRLVYGTDYTITGLGVASGGAVNLVVPALDDDQYLVEGDIPATRTADIAYTASLPSAVINNELDHLQRQIAELRAQLARKLGRSRFDVSGGDSDLPVGRGYAYIDDDGNLTLVDAAAGGGSLTLPLSIEQGGTGGATAAQARANLGLGALATKSLVAFLDVTAGVVQFLVEARTVTAPPGSPSDGQMWIIPSSATGAWAGKTHQIARWSAAGAGEWFYFTPAGGWTAYDKAAQTFLGYTPTAGWAAVAGTGGVAGTLDGRVVGRFGGNGTSGASTRGWWTADNRIFIAGIGVNLSNSDVVTTHANVFPLQVPWDRALGIKNIMSSGTSHYLIDAQDRVWSWGGNASGQLGHGDTTNRPQPTLVLAFSTSSIEIAEVTPSRTNNGGYETTYFRELGGTGRVWGVGNGANYVLGNASTGVVSTPVQIGTLTDVVEVAFDHLLGPALFRRSNGEVYVTGGPGGLANGLGTGAPAQTPSLLPSIANEGIVKMAVAAGTTSHVAAVMLKSSGVPLVCGNGANGLGLGNTSSLTTFQPIPVPDDEVLVDVAMVGGPGVVMAYRSSVNNLHICGWNGAGLRGDGSTASILSLVKPAGGFQGAVDEVKIGGHEGTVTLGVLAGGAIWTCGNDAHGQTAQNKVATAAAARVWGKAEGLDGAVSSWGWSGAAAGYGLSVVLADGRAKGGGYNAEGATGVQPSSLHAIATLQTVLGLPDLVDPAADWYDGAGAPGATLGKNGDRYLDTTSGDVWRKENGVWAASGGNIKGPVGPAGSGGLEYTWSTSTSGDPGTGKILANHATLASATALHVSKTGRNGEPLGPILALLDDSTSTVKGRLRLYVTADRTRWFEGKISGAITDQTTYVVVPLSDVAASATAPAADAAMALVDVTKGDKGDTGSAGTNGTNGAGYGGTSATSLAIGTGSKAFTTQAGLAYTPGQRVRAANTATNYMEGNVSAYSSTTLTIEVTETNGSGTFASWTFGIAGTPGAGAVSSVNGQIGAVSVPVVDALDVERIAGTDLLAIVDANERVVFYAEQDGTGVLPAVKSLGLATLEKVRTGNTETEEVWGLAYAIVHSPSGTLSPTDKVAFYLLDDGTGDQPGEADAGQFVVAGITSTDRPANQAADYNVHLNSGQSLAAAGNGGTVVYAAADFDYHDGAGSISALNNTGSYGVGLVATEQIKYALAGDPAAGRKPTPVYASDYTQVYSSNAFSGVEIEQMFPGASPDRFAQHMTALAGIIAAATAAGKVAQVPFLTWIQGESDPNDANYKADMLFLKDSYNTEVLSRTKQPNRFPMIYTQLAGSNQTTGSPGVPLVGKAQWEAFLEDAEMVLACPLYWLKYADSLHLTETSYRWLGQMLGKVAYLHGYMGKAWRPLYPLSARLRTNNSVLVKLSVPQPPIVLDTTTVPAATNNGFRVRDTSGEITINSVAVVNGDTVRLNLASTPGASPTVEYAWRDHPVDGGVGNYDSNGTHAIRGNIRDSDASLGVYGAGFPLWNWLVRFEMPIAVA